MHFVGISCAKCCNKLKARKSHKIKLNKGFPTSQI